MPARRSVLLAEDDPTLLKLVTRLLAGAGYEVIPATDSTAALETLAARRAGLAAAVLDAAILPAGAHRRCNSTIARLAFAGAR